jgi:hypothetical protein
MGEADHKACRDGSPDINSGNAKAHTQEILASIDFRVPHFNYKTAQATRTSIIAHDSHLTPAT